MFKRSLLALFTTLLLSQAASAQVFQTYDLIVSDPAGVVAAMNKFVESPVGKQSTAAVYLNQYIANGAYQATHQILVVYPSPQEMDANLARNAVAPGWTEFMSEMSQVSQIESEGIGQILAVGGDLSSPLLTNPNRSSIYYQLSATDPAVYASAWSDFTEANADRGIVSHLSRSQHLAAIQQRMLFQISLTPPAKPLQILHSPTQAGIPSFKEQATLELLKVSQ